MLLHHIIPFQGQRDAYMQFLDREHMGGVLDFVSVFIKRRSTQSMSTTSQPLSITTATTAEWHRCAELYIEFIKWQSMQLRSVASLATEWHIEGVVALVSVYIQCWSTRWIPLQSVIHFHQDKEIGCLKNLKVNHEQYIESLVLMVH